MGNSTKKQNIYESSSIQNSVRPRRYIFHDESIDQFIFIWLDNIALENSLDSLRTKTLLRQLNNHCVFYDNINSFISGIESLKNYNKKILLIVSGRFVNEILLQTNDIISSIIIFCRNSIKYNDLLEKHTNIIDICTEHELLKNSIERILPSLRFNLFTNQNSLRSLNSSQNSTNNSAYFSSMLFIDFLKQMPQTKQAKDIMLNKCKDYYRKDQRELERIEIFRNTYKPNQAIDWYTEESFVYRLVNRAFRTEDILLWYLFRFYIIDLCKQLEDVHKEQNYQGLLKVYRGQGRLPTKELENLKSNIGGFISTNGFFSTSKDINTAIEFMSGATDNEEFKVAFFEITVDTNDFKNSIFVDIDQYTGKFGESEILFNIGSVFQVENVDYNNELQAWKIKMKATDGCIDSIKERIESIKKKIQYKNINLLFGHLLLYMNQYTKAESYFCMMLNVLPKSHNDIPLIYDSIGDLNMRITNWKEALKNFNLAYDIKIKNLHSKHSDIAITLNYLGNYYKAIRDYKHALKYYSNVLECQINPFNRATTLINMSSIYIIEKDYDIAFDLCLEARDIIQEIGPNKYTAIIQCHRIIGNIYLEKKDYNIAKEFYLTAFEMSKKHLFIDDYHQIICIKSLANLYYKENLKEKSIDFCLEQLNFYQDFLPENHINVAHLLIIISNLYEDNQQEKIDYLEKALKILEENIHLQYDITAYCFQLIGQYYQKQNNKKKASIFYRKTLEIQKKIYPTDHFILNETQTLINSTEN